ncbi:uncharacterized protein BT62DRAFT_400267 [Guyanagaster necrorhizus]|uniref:HTH APSES-type domain-containing protein n=1 Tax=Guyanagaster necrorhizus TaxID=856835 RepID=A0A9P7W2T7_9AGAR|nr:uncharacterized protein BT62DRAFT_400267 [Guyanagaster necrorhizus MCA 3950]KAG7451137.1 hypothetical protein BT62DRAFT_400267 [Guyanagaster necrorhizus MCA 3950]
MMSIRPSMPSGLNPHLKATVDSGNLPLVKYQILNCQGQDILVGRMKIETSTPSGHAFILRRYDTGAISLTTMFRAAFPTASEQEEKEEIAWVKDNFDLTGNNGSSRDTTITRLAGTWVSPDLAMSLAESYSLGGLINVVVNARPDPGANYRRSGKGAATNTSTVPRATPASPAEASSIRLSSKAPPSPAPAPNPAKRRKESSPLPAKSQEKAPTLRRSARTKSPAPQVSAVPSKSPTTKTPRKSTRRELVDTPGGSEQTVVDEEGDAVEDVMGSELHQQDVAEQKALIEGLKAQRDALKTETENDMDVDVKPKGKRGREEEETLKFEPKEQETEPRVFATNTRVSRWKMEPQTKSMAWGVAAFLFGAGAVTLLPSLF